MLLRVVSCHGCRVVAGSHFLFPPSPRLNNGALVGIGWTRDELVGFGAGPAAAAAVGTDRAGQRCVRTGEMDRERR